MVSATRKIQRKYLGSTKKKKKNKLFQNKVIKEMFKVTEKKGQDTPGKGDSVRGKWVRKLSFGGFIHELIIEIKK